MTLKYHGPGLPLDAHLADPSAHSSAGLAPSSDFAQQRLIVPPASVLAASALATWYTANASTFMRFSLPRKGTYRYVNLYVGVRSGNFQVGVVSVAPDTATTVNVTRVMNSGVTAMSTLSGDNSAQRIDLGATALAAGDYALFLWCDNTTATFLHSLATGLTASRMMFSRTDSGGFPSTPSTTISVTTRWVSGLTLESAT